MLIQNIILFSFKSHFFWSKSTKYQSKKAQNHVWRLVSLELFLEANVFSSIFLYDFVALEKRYRTMLKVVWRVIKLIDRDTRFQWTIHIITYNTGISRQYALCEIISVNVFLDVFIRFCSA